MELKLSDKIALVAASSRGLGKAVAMTLAKEGARVVLCARTDEELQRTKEDIRTQTGAAVLAIQADLTKPADIPNVVAGAIERFGTIHILVNNAGGPPPGLFADVTDDQWQAAFNLTVMSSIRLTREVLPYMRRQKWGRIINITSFSVKQPMNELLLSNSLRLSVIGWAKTLSNQVAGEGVLVNNVCPGWTRTDRVTQLIHARAASHQKTPEQVESEITATIPIARIATPDEFAGVVAFLASERASYITGTSLQIDGGAVRGYF